MKTNTGNIPVRFFHAQDGFPPKLLQETYVDELPEVGLKLSEKVPTGFWLYTVTAVTQESDGVWRIDMRPGHTEPNTTDLNNVDMTF
jgi:hypothetical protein